jgi:uncharacterized protein (TIGR02118 family)
MIHQLIFAAPRPGLTAQQMNEHWVGVHAPRFASRIPQFKQYCVDAALDFPRAPAAPWSGIGEIWFANDEDELASVQSPEYLEGARPDEPNFVAIWQLLVLDTQPHELRAPVAADGVGRPAVKLVVLVKRAAGSSRGEFRLRSLDEHAPLALEIPGLRGYQQNHARDGHYAVGEAPLDAAYELWFDGPEELEAAAGTPEYAKVLADLETFVEPRYTHILAVRENWIIGPDAV